MSQQQEQPMHCMSIDGSGSEHARVPPAEDPASNWLSNSRSTLLVVVTIITTLSFQVGVNPPGGFWQDDNADHKAGDAIMMSKHPKRYLAFCLFSWSCFYNSVVLIMCLLTGISLMSRWFRGIFVFCISNLVFVFLASQTNGSLVWASITSGFVILWGARMVYKSGINQPSTT